MLLFRSIFCKLGTYFATNRIMKKIVLAFVLVFALNLIAAQDINWISLEEAVELQKKTPKKIMIDMYTVWCGPCKLMEKKTFTNPDLVDYVNKHYYAVKFNGEGNEIIDFYGNTFSNPNYDINRKNTRNSTHQFAQFLGVKGYPTTIFLSESGDLITPVVGYLNVHQFELYIKMIKKGDYQVFSTPEDFENYRKYFKPKFRLKSR